MVPRARRVVAAILTMLPLLAAAVGFGLEGAKRWS
jgi:hypothetical protein